MKDRIHLSIWIALFVLSVSLIVVSCGDLRRVNLDPRMTDSDLFGRMKFHVPTQMTVGIDCLATLYISKSSVRYIIEKTIPETRNPFYKTADSLILTQMVEVRLIDPFDNNFTISSITKDIQLVDTSQITYWQWKITPNTSGRNILTVLVTNQYLNGNQLMARTLLAEPVFRREIEVESNFRYSISKLWSDYWEFVLTAMAFPLLAFAYNWYSKKKEKEQEDKKRRDEQYLRDLEK